jgi:Ca2+-binding RTX toxin-like protein
MIQNSVEWVNPNTSVNELLTALVVIDSNIADYSSLAAGVVAGAKLLILDPQQDGVEQISIALRQNSLINSLHIISHGSPGCVYLGSTQLNLETIDRYALELQSWSVSQILLYGCNVAAGDAGAEFVEKLHSLTEAKIAASTTPTGNAALGGNWELEVAIGEAALSLAFQPETLTAYSAVFGPPLLSVSGSVTANGSTAKAIAPSLTINPNGTSTLDGARVSVGTNFSSNDRLGINGLTSGSSNGVNWTYNSGTGILTFTGTAAVATYETLLRQVTYSSSGTPSGGARNVQFSLGSSIANPNNGHFYEFVSSSGITWQAAKTAAEGRSYFGLQGYLTTITSVSENSFVASKLQGEGWMGSSDAAAEGVWRWVTGPEATQQFWAGTGSGNAVNGMYENWATGEPNNSSSDPSGEDHGHFLSTGEWNDYLHNNTSIEGYVVEYGGMTGDPTLQITGSVTVNIDATPPTVSAPDLTDASDTNIINDNITKLFNLTFAGTTEAGATVQLFEGATVLGVATVSGTSWSYTGTFSPGNHTITAKATDSAGNIATSSSLTFTIDNSVGASNPVLVNDSGTPGDNITKFTNLNFTGIAETGATVQIYEGANLLGNATLTGANWTYNGTFSAGDHTITANVTDVAGNTVTSPALTFTVDTTAPTVPSAPDLADASDSGNSTDNKTNLTNLTFTGTTEAGTTVQLFEGANLVGTATVTGTAWTHTGTFSQGNHTIIARASDTAGNTTDSGTLTFTVDTTPPTVSAPDLLDDSDSRNPTDNKTKLTDLTFTGTTEAGATVEIYEGANLLGNATVSGTTWTYTGTFNPGDHIITAKAIDVATNTATSSALTFNVDTTAPGKSAPDMTDASDSGASNKDNITSIKKPTFTGKTEANATVEVFDGATLLGTATANGSGDWTFTPSNDLSLDSHSITTKVTDVAGNVGSTSDPLNVIINTTGNPLAVTVASINSSDSTPAIVGTVSEPNATIKVTIDGKTYDATNNGDGTWTLLNGAITTELPNGTYDVKVDATAGSETITDTTTNELTVNAVTPPSLNLPAVPTVANGTVPKVVNSSLTVTGNSLDGARVSIGDNFNASEDRLGILGQAGTSGKVTVGSETINWSYNTTSGVMTFTGTASSATYEAALRQVTYYSDGTPSGSSREIEFSLGSNLSNSENGHFYEFIAADGITWTQAKVAAESKTYFGLQGYLTTVTSTSENAFIASKLQGEGWMGSSDAATEGVWRWVTGPEAGQQFWSGDESGNAVNGMYENWATGEPNNSSSDPSGEDHGHFLSGGNWNDYLYNNTSIEGYVVEYGGMPGDPTLKLTGSTTIALDTTAPTAPTNAPDLLDASDTGASTTDNLTGDNTPTFTGKLTNAEAGYIVTLYDGNAPVGTGIVQADGTWSITASALSNGVRTIKYTITDLAGNESQKSSGLDITVDAVLPATPVVGPDLTDASDTGTSKTDDITADTTPTFKGTGVAGQIVRIYDANTKVGEAIVGDDGNWSVTTSELSTGNHLISSTFVDSVTGNESEKSVKLAIEINPSAVIQPTTPQLDPNSGSTNNNGGLTKNNMPTLRGVAEPGTTVELIAGDNVIGTAVVQADGSWSLKPTTALLDGTYQVKVRTGDIISPEVPLTIDTRAATVKILDYGATVRDSSVDAIRFQFNEAVSNLDLSDIVLTLKGQPVSLEGATISSTDNQTWTLGNIPGMTTNSGDYQISIKPGKVSDAAGNVLAIGDSNSWLTGFTADASPTIQLLDGKRGNNMIGNAGADELRGGTNKDRIKGLAGDDRLSGWGGSDKINAGAGKDYVRGGAGRDRITGGGGNDRLLGNGKHDRLLGGGGKDRLVGGKGDDVLVGGGSKDTLIGGEGKDTFVYNKLKDGSDRIRKFESGNDLIDLRSIFNAPQFAGDNRFARFHQFVQLEQVGAATQVRVDADGSGSGTAFTTLATLQNVAVSDVSSTNFIIGNK